MDVNEVSIEQLDKGGGDAGASITLSKRAQTFTKMRGSQTSSWIHTFSHLISLHPDDNSSLFSLAKGSKRCSKVITVHDFLPSIPHRRVTSGQRREHTSSSFFCASPLRCGAYIRVSPLDTLHHDALR